MSDDQGSPTKYTVYNGTKPKQFSFKPYQPLSEVRTLLEQAGFMTHDDAFLYINPATKLKTVFTPQSTENKFVLGTAQPHTEAGAAFPPIPSQGINDPIVQIVSVARDKPSFLGTSPSDGWLRQSPVMGVKCRLNNSSDPTIVSNNKDMFEPVMLQNIVSANPNNPAAFTHCIIVQKGAIVTFDISSWGAAGWAYNITSSMGKSIVPGWLYASYGAARAGSQSTMSMSRYSEGGNTGGPSIQIDSNTSLGIAKQFNVQYSTLLFKAWSLSECGGYKSDLTVPNTVAQAGGGFNPGPPAGDVTIPGGSTSSAAPKGGPPSKQKFVSSSSKVVPSGPPNTRAEGLTGALQIYMLVFNSKADANQVIRVLNADSLAI